MEINKISKESFKKLLYSDNSDDSQRVYLNINLLRKLKKILLENMTEKEKGCINLYHLENYLIERALDPMTEEIFRGKNIKYYLYCEDLIDVTLNFLRSKPEYWILNSEIYLEIILKNDQNFYYDDKYENKDLSAIYTYIFKNNNFFYKKQIPVTKIENSTDENMIYDLINEENFEKLVNDTQYCEFVKLLEKESFFQIDYTNKTLFDVKIIPNIYKFTMKSFEMKYSHILIDVNPLNTQSIQIRLQNFILFFSYAHYDKELDYLWTYKSETKVNPSLVSTNVKKYSLRLNKVNEEELDQIFIQNQIKMLTLHEELNKNKNLSRNKEFLEYLKENKLPNEIIKAENNSKEKNEIKMKMLINSYRTLNNILLLSEYFLLKILNISKEVFHKFHEENMQEKQDILFDEIHNFKELTDLFNTFKNLKTIYTSDLTDKEINSFIIFYSKIIEKDIQHTSNSCNNYSGCIEILKFYSKFNKKKFQNEALNLLQDKKFEKSFGSQFSKQNLDKINTKYIHNYYEAEATQRQRIYKTENAGLNWTDDDMKKFKEGLDLYGSCQLANIKIAKFMGAHIEASHVKLFRSKISKEKRIKRKYEKDLKISEMKKTKNLKWKAVEGDLDLFL